MIRLLKLPLLLFLLPTALLSQSWERALKDKHASLDLYWYESHPFIYPSRYPDHGGSLTGLEYDIMVLFQRFVKDEYEVELSLNWEEGVEFHAILDSIKNTRRADFMGVSAFSITEERKTFAKYTGSYMPDITVLVSSAGTPIVKSYKEMEKLIGDMQAITIRGTIYEKFLLDLKNQLGIDFEMKYISSDENVLDHVLQSDRSFAFIDLPIYLMWIKDGINVVRQNFFTVYGMGYGFIIPQHSDWNVPFNVFLKRPEIQTRISEIIAKYIGPELYDFIGNLDESELLGTSILTKEKEIQLALIENANLRLEEARLQRRFLQTWIIVIFIFLLIITWMLFQNWKVNKRLRAQKEQIESQQADIQSKNEQLMSRNSKLLELNEEKNYLMNILAHDLSSPLGYVMGLSDILLRSDLQIPETERSYLKSICEGTQRMNQMVTKLLRSNINNDGTKLVIKDEIDVTKVMKDIVARFDPIARKKGIVLRLVGAEDVCMLKTDYMLLLLIFENLVSNAIKFSLPGTSVTIEKRRLDDGQVLFLVADQGPGFTEEDQKHLFKRLQRLSAQPTAGESSTGLGLSIVKKYVTDLGGHIRLETEAGSGSTFWISFPTS